MKKNIFLLLLFLQFFQSGFAQVRVLSLKKNTGHWRAYSFPFIQSSVNKKAAGEINSYLQTEILYNDEVLSDTNKIFEKSRYINEDSNHQSGYSEISYSVIRNNADLLSLVFEIETTGAYSYTNQKYCNFNARTGDLLTAKDLFTPAGTGEMKKKLLKTRTGMIDRIMNELDSLYSPLADSASIRETYVACNTDAAENNFLIKEKSIVFYKGNCFPHWGLLYDSDLAVEFTYRELAVYLSEDGKKLVLPRSNYK